MARSIAIPLVRSKWKSISIFQVDILLVYPFESCLDAVRNFLILMHKTLKIFFLLQRYMTQGEIPQLQHLSRRLQGKEK